MSTIHDRMKHNYEEVSRTRLTRRTPVIIRLDGKAFHTFTKNLKKPYDEIFHTAMNQTMKYLCENIQGCKLGYTQSDEINLLLSDFDTLTTDAWFDYEVQKMCSVSASMATFAFNKYFYEASRDILRRINNTFTCTTEEARYANALEKAIEKGGMFDARCFNIPLEEVANCFIWRQQDAIRNAIQMLGQAHFSSKELHKKKNNDILVMLEEKGIKFEDMPEEFQRGACCRKVDACKPKVSGEPDSGIDFSTKRKVWYIDKKIPDFVDNREYINKLLTTGE